MKPRYSALELDSHQRTLLERHGHLLPGETPAAALERADHLEVIARDLIAANAFYSGELLQRVAEEIRAEALRLGAGQAVADYLPCDTEASDG